MELVVLLGAESDIQMAFNRFEDYGEGLGLKFLQELELAYQYIGRHPRTGRLYANNRRRFLVPNFLAALDSQKDIAFSTDIDA
jgi:hypothetical protein